MRTLALIAAAALWALPARADDAERIADALSAHLTHHGEDVVLHQAGLVESGDVPFSRLKDDLRAACGAAEECLRGHGLSAEDTMLAMSLLVARRAEEDLDARIKVMQARNERVRQLTEELKAKPGERERISREIDRLNHESQIEAIEFSRMVNKRNEAIDQLTNLLNRFQRTLDGVVANMR